MKRKRKGQQPSFDGLVVKLNRAKAHLATFYDSSATRACGIRYCFVPEIRNNGRTHIYRVENAPPPDLNWSGIVGDCLHNIRSALDHLACALVWAHGGQPGPQTQFPICTTPTTRSIWRQRKGQPLKVRGGVDPGALQIIEAIQPYNRSQQGLVLDALRRLDNRDKHRELIFTESALVQGLAGTAKHPDAPPPPIDIHFTGQTIENKNVIAVLTYDPPQAEANPYLGLGTRVTFAPGSPCFTGAPVGLILSNLIGFVEGEIVPLFLPYLLGAAVDPYPMPDFAEIMTDALHRRAEARGETAMAFKVGADYVKQNPGFLGAPHWSLPVSEDFDPSAPHPTPPAG